MLRIALASLLSFGVVSLGDEPKKPDKPADKPPAKPSDPPPRPRPTPEQIVDMILQRMDTNKDGKISKEEAKDRIAENFAAIDTNKDGYLDRAELLVMARRMVQSGPPPGRPGGPFGGPG